MPVTPPMKEMTSLHILRLTHPRQDRYKVDLFIRDEDLYFVAFRIMNKSNEQIGRCFSFNDSHIVLPNFLNAVKIPMSSSYGPPYASCLMHIHDSGRILFLPAFSDMYLSNSALQRRLYTSRKSASNRQYVFCFRNFSPRKDLLQYSVPKGCL